MDYKFTFEDGSEAIAHYGTKGMKWGVWNAETRARYNAEGHPISGGGKIDEEIGVSPGMGGLYDEEKFEEGSENAQEAIENVQQYLEEHPLDQQWNEFTSQVANSPLTGNAQAAADAGQAYVDNVLSTSTRFGTDAENAAGDVGRIFDNIGQGNFEKAGAALDDAVKSVPHAVDSGVDYVLALFGQRRR